MKENRITNQQNSSLTLQKESPLGLVKTVNDALNYPTLAKQMKDHGAEQVVMVFIAEVTRNLKGFNVKETMTIEQIEMFCEDFLTEYKFESLADIKIMFKRARLGKYKNPHGYIDSNQIMEWFNEYLLEKAQAREQRHKQLKNSNKAPIKSSEVSITSEQIEALRNEINKSESENK